MKEQDLAMSPISVFYSYAHEDEKLRNALERHLSALRRQGIIAEWHDRQIVAGTDWAKAIDAHLLTATVILLLISPDFMSSDYCYGIELDRAIERDHAHKARVLPIILRPTDIEGAPFAHLQCLPRNGKPVTMWLNRDAAFLAIVREIRAALEALRPTPHVASQSSPSSIQPPETRLNVFDRTFLCIPEAEEQKPLLQEQKRKEKEGSRSAKIVPTVAPHNDVVERIVGFHGERNHVFIKSQLQAMRYDIFAFFRGTCHLFYEDWPAHSVLNGVPLTWICGNLHMENLGSYRANNQMVYFNMNNFDESSLAPCTWDLARFLVSVLISAHRIKISQEKALKLCDAFLESYTKTLVNGSVSQIDEGNAVGVVKNLLIAARERQRKDFLDRHTELTKNGRRLRRGRNTPMSMQAGAEITLLLNRWGREQSSPTFFNVLDVGERGVGIGSLGTEHYVVLVEGKGSPDQNSVLDLKVASSTSFLPLRQPHWSSEAERIVTIQRWIQGIPPALLATVEHYGKSYILRELQPAEDKVQIASLDGKMQHLKELVCTIAKIVAWGQLRSGGSRGSADAADLKSFVQKSSWQDSLMRYVQSYALRVEKYYLIFNSSLDPM